MMTSWNAAQQVEEAFGETDVWVNTATLSVFSPENERTAEDVRRVTESPYIRTMHGERQVRPSDAPCSLDEQQPGEDLVTGTR